MQIIIQFCCFCYSGFKREKTVWFFVLFLFLEDGSGSLGRQKRNDSLHYAADSVTNAMSSLVRELKTG